MKKVITLFLVAAFLFSGMAAGANYMYEKSKIQGVGYKNSEIVAQTQTGLGGNKLVQKESGSGNIVTSTLELEIQRNPFFGTSDECLDYINYTKVSEVEYMPISYQTGTYDQKWIDKLCVQNYYIGAVAVQMFTNAEHIQQSTEVKTRKDSSGITGAVDCGECTGALEANFNANVIGVAHLGWLSKNTQVNSKGRHDEYGRSVEDLTGVFSIEKFIQLWGNDTCGAVQVDWLPCI